MENTNKKISCDKHDDCSKQCDDCLEKQVKFNENFHQLSHIYGGECIACKNPIVDRALIIYPMQYLPVHTQKYCAKNSLEWSHEAEDIDRNIAIADMFQYIVNDLQTSNEKVGDWANAKGFGLHFYCRNCGDEIVSYHQKSFQKLAKTLEQKDSVGMTWMYNMDKQYPCINDKHADSYWDSKGMRFQETPFHALVKHLWYFRLDKNDIPN